MLVSNDAAFSFASLQAAPGALVASCGSLLPPPAGAALRSAAAGRPGSLLGGGGGPALSPRERPFFMAAAPQRRRRSGGPHGRQPTIVTESRAEPSRAEPSRRRRLLRAERTDAATQPLPPSCQGKSRKMFKFSVVLFFAILATSTCKKDRCLGGGIHKPRPSPEPDMHECTQYSESSCCYANLTEQLAHSPVIQVSNSYWNRCGNLSKSCEDYMKKIECFYQCSPHAAHWINSNYTAAIDFVPLCQNFCDDWYEACKNDFTCIRSWITDWEWDDNGENHCKNECIPYNKMYANATDMCQSMWGDSFKVSDSSCLCLQMNEKDAVAIKYLISKSSEESSSEERACRRKLRKTELRKKEKGEETLVFEIL